MSDSFECENCNGYLVYLGHGNRRKCERCGHTQYVSSLPKENKIGDVHQWARAAAMQQKKISELTSVLREAQPIICSYLCPSVKKENEEWAHVDLCMKIVELVGGEK